MKRLLLVAFLSGLLAPGCTYYHLSDYQFGLDHVKSDGTRQKEVSGTSFEDELVKISLHPTRKKIAFQLQNKSESTIRVHWNKASIVTPSGAAARIIHKGTRFSDSSGEQGPTSIPAGATLKDVVVPADRISFGEDGWEIDPYLPRRYNDGKEHKGASVRFLLPISMAEDKAREYDFEVGLKDVKRGEKKSSGLHPAVYIPLVLAGTAGLTAAFIVGSDNN